MNELMRTTKSRLWDTLMEMAEIGKTDLGGCNRQALTGEDKQGRDLFISWCQDVGLSISIDQMGNIFARREGTDNSAPIILIGSHLDTQPTGGKFDGVYGVLAGLEVIRTLNENDIKIQNPIEIAVWTNEEGARFSPAMIGSGVYAGVFDLEYGLSRADKSGKTIGECLEKIGFSGKIPCEPKPIKAAFEVHIEQGPILEANENQVGVVSGVQGTIWYDLILMGASCHAGPTPMSMRRDPMKALGAIIPALYDWIENIDNKAKITFGDITASPGARNTVPEEVIMAIDIRHPNKETLDKMDQDMKKIISKTASRFDIKAIVREEWKSTPVTFDKSCVNIIKKSAENLKIKHEIMISGAGHDSVYISKIAPTAMIFVPCKDGLSHNELESAKPADLAAGCDVLLQTVLNVAN